MCLSLFIQSVLSCTIMKTTERLLEAQEYLQSRLVVVRSVYVVAQIGYVWYHKMFKIQTKFEQINNCMYKKIKGNNSSIKIQRQRLNNICITNQSHCHTSQLAKMSTLQTEHDCSLPCWGISGYSSKDKKETSELDLPLQEQQSCFLLKVKCCKVIPDMPVWDLKGSVELQSASYQMNASSTDATAKRKSY